MSITLTRIEQAKVKDPSGNPSDPSGNHNAKKIILMFDIAALSHLHSPIQLLENCINNVLLDAIEIDANKFKNIFYSTGDSFGINPSTLPFSDPTLKFTSCLPPHRTQNGQPFILSEELLKYAEYDLGVSRISLSTSSVLDFLQDISKIQSIKDVTGAGGGTVDTALTWSNICSIIQNEQNARNLQNKLTDVILAINLLFKSENPAIKDTMVKFQYKISDVENFV